MGATYTHAEVYTIRATCETPFRTGDESGSLETVLYSSDGRMIIQGNSIAGALGAWCRKNRSEEYEEFFGKIDRGGSLIISDGIFEVDDNLILKQRPHVKIDRETGCVDNNAKSKFDMVHISKGAVFTFSITWLGGGDDNYVSSKCNTIECMLAALNTGDIRLGAYKTNGFGKVSLKVQKQSYDLTDDNGRKDWINESVEKKEVTLPYCDTSSKIIFELSGHISNLLIKASELKTAIIETGKTGSKNITANIEEHRHVIIPASSIRGIVRSRAESIALYMGLKNCDSILNELFGCNESAGKVCFEDIRMTLDKNCKKLIQTRLMIDYFTGGKKNRALINEEILSGELKTTITVEPEMYVYSGLILLALRDLGLGLYSIGSGSGIGRGYIENCTISLKKGSEEDNMAFDEDRNITLKENGEIFSDMFNQLEKFREGVYAEADRAQ